MKIKSLLLFLFFSVSALSSRALATTCGTTDISKVYAYAAVAIVTGITTPPVLTTSLIACAIADNSEVNKLMLEREATLLAEENKIFIPSFLGSYADQNHMTLVEAAQDIFRNGVR